MEISLKVMLSGWLILRQSGEVLQDVKIYRAITIPCALLKVIDRWE